MDKVVVELLSDKIDKVDSKVDELHSDVKLLLANKSKLEGIKIATITIVSALVTGLINFGAYLLKH